MSRAHRCPCGREIAAGAPMASHRRRCPAAIAQREARAAEEAARLAAVAATVCPKCDAGPGEECTEPGRRPGTRILISQTVKSWETHHHERHQAERVARLGY